MPSDKFSTKQKAALFALLAEAREISNPELKERFGFALDGPDREKLNNLKLVDSRREGRPYLHELTDAGWKWCADELSAAPGSRAGTIERALYGVLAGLGHYLDGTGQSLADIFAPRGTGAPQKQINEADVEASIMAGYRALASEPGEFIKLSGLRQKLSEIPRAAVDAALDTMYRAQRVNLIPQANQVALTTEDRESALRLGGEHKHLISIERR
jgi:hypothetical protein